MHMTESSAGVPTRKPRFKQASVQAVVEYRMECQIGIEQVLAGLKSIEARLEQYIAYQEQSRVERRRVSREAYECFSSNAEVLARFLDLWRYMEGRFARKRRIVRLQFALVQAEIGRVSEALAAFREQTPFFTGEWPDYLGEPPQELQIAVTRSAPRSDAAARQWSAWRLRTGRGPSRTSPRAFSPLSTKIRPASPLNRCLSCPRTPEPASENATGVFCASHDPFSGWYASYKALDSAWPKPIFRRSAA